MNKKSNTRIYYSRVMARIILSTALMLSGLLCGEQMLAQTRSLTIEIVGSGSVNTTVASVSDPGPYEQGTVVDVEAAPVSTDWVFTGWSGDLSGLTNPTSITMDKDKSITATFKEVLTLTVTSGGNGTVAREPDQDTYLTGDLVTITASPAAGYSFSNWSVDYTGTDNPATVTVNSDMTVQANFSQDSYTLGLTATTGGSAAQVPAGPTHLSGTPVQITATPDQGWYFSGWSGDHTGMTNPDNVTMDEDKTIVANFEQYNYTLTLGSTLGGSAAQVPVGPLHPSGTDVTITATPETGYNFTGWTGSLTSPENPAVVDMDGDKTITANFADKTYLLTVETDGTTDGTNPATVNPSGTFSVIHAQSTVLQVTYIPVGYEFVQWSVTEGTGADIVNPTSLTASVTLTGGDATVEASFVQKQYTLSVITDGTTDGVTVATVSPSSPLLVNHGQATAISVTNIPEGYQFKEWIPIGSLGVTITNSTEPSTWVTLENGNATIQATFESKKYSLNLLTDGTPNASVNPVSVQATHGVPEQISASTTEPGYKFKNWTIVSGDPSGIEFTNDTLATTYVTLTTDNVTLRANFELKKYRLTVLTDGTSGAATVPSGAITVTHGVPQDIAVTSLPEGYKLKNWTPVSGDVTFGNDTLQSTTATVVNGNAIIQANFELKKYKLTLLTDATPGAAVIPADPVLVTHGQTRFIFASVPALSGYRFKQWDVVEGDVKLGNDTLANTTALLTTDDVILRATFQLKKYTLSLVTDGTPGATVSPEDPVAVEHGIPQLIRANTIPVGYKFRDWTIYEGAATIENDTMEMTTATLTTGNAILQANFKKFLEITDVTIPNVTMGIGVPVTATITVSNDAGNPYLLVTGRIGGYPLTNLLRVNSTTYKATFTVTEGGNSYDASSNIPVTNLILSDGLIQNIPYNKPIIQNEDAIDAKYPVINSMSVDPGLKKVGDIVILNINADSTNYAVHPTTTINGTPVTAPNVVFSETGFGNYRLIYTVLEGDPNVAPGKLQAAVKLVKPSLNTNDFAYTIILPNTLEIDARPPVISRMEVSQEEVGTGQKVQLIITADGEGYTAGSGTVINGIPLSSSRVNLSEVTGGLYVLNYMVAIGDNNVAPGNLTASVVLKDSAGNSNSLFSDIVDNELEIYTDPPTAQLNVIPEICEGEQATITVFLSGRGPWGFDMNDGRSTYSYKFIETSPYIITGTLDRTTTFEIDSIWDRNGVSNAGQDPQTILVNEKTDVTIMNLASGYSIEDEEFRLWGSPTNGEFSGPGVITSGDYYYFYPSVAGTENSPHTIYYQLTDANECTSIDSALVFVLSAEGDIFMPDTAFCTNNDPVTITGSNLAGATGSFMIQNINGQNVSGLTDNGDNTALLDPSLLVEGKYIIFYQYFDGAILSLRDTFSVASAQNPAIIGLGDEYCQSVPPVVLTSDLANAAFSGPGVYGNVTDGYLFYPDSVSPGSVTVVCTVTSSNGCPGIAEKKVTIKYAPDLGFNMSTSCISDNGGEIAFENTSDGKLLIDSWSWNFDDPGSGENNTSTLINPQHFYASPGEREIELTATTHGGCVVTYVMDTIIGNMPIGDFTWESDCSTDETGTRFINKTVSEFTPLESSLWVFKNSQGTELGTIDADPPADPVNFYLEEIGTYTVELYAINSSGCSDTVIKEITLHPTVIPGIAGYDESFNTSQGLWSVQSDNQLSSWVWDVPDFTDHVPEPGDKAWFTQLPSSVVGYMEHSWIQSPCFDLSNMERPLIQVDIMRSFTPDNNGAVLQYMDVIEDGWKTIGETTPGIDWYNADSITNLPGGSSVGWALEGVFNPDTEWIKASHDLDPLGGKSNVKFRMAISTEGAQGSGNQGFAFDNIYITDRTKLAVLEHFTNSADASSRSADDLIDRFGKDYSKDVIDIQYHMSFPGIDSMNIINSLAPLTRRLYYGVEQVPYAILDGGVSEEYRYDFSDLKTTPDVDHLRLISLQVPEFDVQLEVDWLEETMEYSTTVTCKVDHYTNYLDLFVVVFETSVSDYTGLNGDTLFENVVRQILPFVYGDFLGENWSRGNTDTRTNSWIYENYEDIDDLAVVAFVQDRVTKKILQAAVNYKTPQVGIGQKSLKETPLLFLYPNPARNMVNVSLGASTERNGRFEIIDMNGRVVMKEFVPSGHQVYQLQIGSLYRGFYMIRWYEGDTLKAFSKLVKID